MSSDLLFRISSICCFCCFKRADAEMDWMAGLELPEALALARCFCKFLAPNVGRAINSLNSSEQDKLFWGIPSFCFVSWMIEFVPRTTRLVSVV